MARCEWIRVMAVGVAAGVAAGAAVDWASGLVLGTMVVLGLVARRARRAEPRPHPVADPVPEEVVVYEVSGPMHLGAAQRAMAALNHIGHPARAVVLRLEAVDSLDATGLVALESALDEVERHPALAVLAGVNAQPLARIHDADILRRRGVLLCGDPRKAVGLAACAARGAAPPQASLTRPANRPE